LGKRTEFVALDVGERQPLAVISEHASAQFQKRRHVADVDVDVNAVLHDLGPLFGLKRQ
jgi:hypothetical protein